MTFLDTTPSGRCILTPRHAIPMGHACLLIVRIRRINLRCWGWTIRLVGSIDGYNIVLVAGRHYSVPQSLGPMDLGSLDLSAPPTGILVTQTYGEALAAVSEAIRA